MKKPIIILTMFLAACADTQPNNAVHASNFIYDPGRPAINASTFIYDPAAPPVRASAFLRKDAP